MKTLYRLGGVLLCLQLAGCSGMHLYSAKRDQQGKDLKTAASTIDSKSYFDAIHMQDKKLLKAELDVIPGARAAAVESQTAALLDMPVGDADKRSTAVSPTFYSTLEAELTQLVGGADRARVQADLQSWRASWLDLVANRVSQATYRKFIKAEGAAAPACPAEKPSNATAGAPPLTKDAAEYLKVLGRLCGKEATLVERQQSVMARLTEGSLGQGGQQMAKLETAYARASQEADKLMAQYRTSMQEYKAAVSASKPGAAPSAQLVAASNKLRKVVDQLANAGALGKEAAAEERLARIDAVLKKLGSTAEPDKDATRADMAAVLVTRLADDAQVLADLQKPVAPISLLIRRDLEKNRADIARLDADLMRKEIDLVRRTQASRIDEAAQLLGARSRLNELNKCALNLSVLDVATIAGAGGKPECGAEQRAHLYEAAGRYLYAIGNQRAVTLQLTKLQRDVPRERHLGYQQANAEQYALLIDASANLASEYAASGQKASDYSHLLQLPLLFWIGHGVER